jgi:D-alanyl-lipoteichoic acid acyltransferase DltB (MBOAT superfamily)
LKSDAFTASGQGKKNLTTRESQAGAYQFIWGLVKKVVIADTCATYANAILTTIHELLVFTPRGSILPFRFTVTFWLFRYGFRNV